MIIDNGQSCTGMMIIIWNMEYSENHIPYGSKWDEYP